MIDCAPSTSGCNASLILPAGTFTNNGELEVRASGSGSTPALVLGGDTTIAGSGDILMCPGMTNWVLVANPGGGPLTATIKVGGSTLGTYSIAPGRNVTPTFPGKIGGPVAVSATANVIASQRVLYNGYFNEVLGQ